MRNVTAIDSPYLEMQDNKQKLVVCHFPIKSWHGLHKGAWHVHGHCHNTLQEVVGKSMDIGIDATWENLGLFRPISWDEVGGVMSTKEIVVVDAHGIAKDR
jgi:calcineurin-like phosphoesterase family protein